MSDALGVMGTRQLRSRARFITRHSSPITASQWHLRVSSPLQRRDREGLAPSSLTQESQCAGTLGEEGKVVKINNEQP